MVTASSPQEQLVLDLFDGMGPDIESFKVHLPHLLTGDVVWEIVGWDNPQGINDCLAYVDTAHRDRHDEVQDQRDHLASAGDVVLTERVDEMLREDGSLVMSFRVMGALEVRGDKIVRYTDYLDTMGTAAKLQSLPTGMGHAPVEA